MKVLANTLLGRFGNKMVVVAEGDQSAAAGPKSLSATSPIRSTTCCLIPVLPAPAQLALVLAVTLPVITLMTRSWVRLGGSPRERSAARDDEGPAVETSDYIGRLWWGKGTRPLLAAYARVARDLPHDTSLLLVGDGPDEALIARTSELDGLHVKLAGFRQKAELPRMYAAGDVFVFPSLGDPYGLVVDEAMAAGLPVISTTAAGEIRERVVDDVNGFLVPPDDPVALAAAMRRLATDPALRNRMGSRSADMIVAYTPDRWAEAFEKAVDGILAAAPVRAS